MPIIISKISKISPTIQATRVPDIAPTKIMPMQIENNQCVIVISFLIKTPKNKKCVHRSRRKKTQTPIVAKPTEKQEQIYAISGRNLHFYQIQFGYNAKRV